MQQTLFNVANHSNQGKDFEKQLEATHEWYRLQGWADVRKIPNSWDFISANEYRKLQTKLPASHLATTADGRFMQRVKSDVDFVGGGATFGVCFDAKTCGSKSFSLANIRSHQLRKLKERERCRIISGVMVYMTIHNRVFFVPYKYLENRMTILFSQAGNRAKVGTASISLAEFETHAAEIFKHKMNMCWDWRAVLVK